MQCRDNTIACICKSSSTGLTTKLTLAHPLCADLDQSELEDLLDEALQVDFNIQAEDDSPYLVRPAWPW